MNKPDFGLKAKVAVVTGGGGVLGGSISKGLAEISGMQMAIERELLGR